MLNKKHLITMYYSLFWSVATYGIRAWGGSLDTNFKYLHNIHKHILKIIFHNNKRYPSDLLYVENSVLSLRKLFFEKAILRNYMPLQNKLTNSLITNKRVTTLQLPPVGRELFRRNHNYVSHKLFNLLPQHLKFLDMNKTVCKKYLRNWIIAEPNHTFVNIFKSS